MRFPRYMNFASSFQKTSTSMPLLCLLILIDDVLNIIWVIFLRDAVED